jgi:cyclopropane-fatty-acyl-phospholipid synthase
VPLANRLDRLISEGTLTVVDAKGNVCRFGSGAAPAATIRLADGRVPLAFLLDAELALPEAYMDGRLVIEEGDLRTLLEMLLRNLRRHGPDARFGTLARLHELMLGLARRNPIGRAQANVAHHYDLSGELYALFLDAERAYSCAYFAAGHEDIDTAQRAKERHIAEKLVLRPGHRVLDIGSGWGALTRHLCEFAGRRIHATGITLSREQLAWAEARAAERGLADRLDYRLADYREVDGRFDRIVSVGMFEHVGRPHYDEFFARIRDLLTGDGVALLHSIGRMEPPGGTNPWIRKYIFPGGYTPALSEVLGAIERVGLWVTDIEILRLHYADTLRHWRQRFDSNRARIADIYDERFCRMWEFYLIGCEIAFRRMNQMVFQIQIARRQEAVPLTRDYMLEFEQAHRERAPATAAAAE